MKPSGQGHGKAVILFLPLPNDRPTDIAGSGLPAACHDQAEDRDQRVAARNQGQPLAFPRRRRYRGAGGEFFPQRLREIADFRTIRLPALVYPAQQLLRAKRLLADSGKETGQLLGIMVESGSPGEMLSHPRHERTRAFLARVTGARA